MTDKRAEDNRPRQAPPTAERRSALTKLLAGAGAIAGAHTLPDRWVRPVISSVVLPAHAAASAADCGITGFQVRERGAEGAGTEAESAESERLAAISFKLTSDVAFEGEAEVTSSALEVSNTREDTIQSEGNAETITLEYYADGAQPGGDDWTLNVECDGVLVTDSGNFETYPNSE